MRKAPVSAIFALMLLAATLAGCATTNARSALAQAETAYAAVVETAIELREFGIMDEETARQLTPAFVEANRLLDRANQAIVDGQLELAEEHRRAAEALIAALSRRLSRI